MRLEPVYLVAPRPQPNTVPTRRAFLYTGLGFAGGAVLGAACGYSLGKAAVAEEAPSTGNAELDELRRLATVAPIEELVDRRLQFLMLRDRFYRTDEVLWKGVARLSAEVLDNDKLQNRRILAGLLAASIDKGDPPVALGLKDQLPDLRRIAR